jgi:hypothetical protein
MSPTNEDEAPEIPTKESKDTSADNGRKIPLGDPYVTTIAVRRQALADAGVIAKALEKEERQAEKLETQFRLLQWGNIDAQFGLRMRQARRILMMRRRIPKGYVAQWRSDLEIECRKLGCRYREDRIRDDLRLALAVERDPTLEHTIPALAMEEARVDFRRLLSEVQARSTDRTVEEPDTQQGEDEGQTEGTTAGGPSETPMSDYVRAADPAPQVPGPLPVDPVDDVPPDPQVIQLRAELERERAATLNAMHGFSEVGEANEELHAILDALADVVVTAPGKVTFAMQEVTWSEPTTVGELLDRIEQLGPPSVYDRIRNMRKEDGHEH